MKTAAPLRVAMICAAMVQALACEDVYEVDLGDVGPEASSLPTVGVDAGVPPPPVIPRSEPVLCPEVLKEVMAGGDGGDGGAAACDLPGAVCEYGASPDRQCNDVYTCGTAGSDPWRRLPNERCAAAQCPANRSAAALEGLPCGIDGGVDDSDELVCNMSDGTCACTTGRGGSDVHARRWTCTKPLSACPVARPLIGQPCIPGLLCDYGSCRSKRGMAMECLAGVWAVTSIDCGP